MTKIFRLGNVAVLQLLAVTGLVITTGCVQEDPPMPPGIYVGTQPVPKQNVPAVGNNINKPVAPESVFEYKESGTPVEPVIAPPPQPQQPSVDDKAKPAKKDQVYVVVKGDSLWSLSRKFGVTIENLALYNNLPANAKLRIKQRLYIPQSGKAVKAPAPKAMKKAKAPKARSAKVAQKKAPKAKKTVSKKEQIPANGVYVVKKGDSFARIAKRYGVKVADIAAANPGVSSNKLKIGQKLRISGKAAALPGDEAPVTDVKPVADTPVLNEPEKTAEKTKTVTEDSLLDDVAGSSDSELPELKAPTPPAASAAPAATPAQPKPVLASDNAAEKAQDDAVKAVTVESIEAGDKVNDDGSVVPAKDTTVAQMAAKYQVQEADIKTLNPAIPADGKIKAGTTIKMP